MKITDLELASIGFIHYDQMGDSSFFNLIINEYVSFSIHCFNGIVQCIRLMGFEKESHGMMKTASIDFEFNTVEELKNLIDLIKKYSVK